MLDKDGESVVAPGLGEGQSPKAKSLVRGNNIGCLCVKNNVEFT